MDASMVSKAFQRALKSWGVQRAFDCVHGSKRNQVPQASTARARWIAVSADASANMRH